MKRILLILAGLTLALAAHVLLGLPPRARVREMAKSNPVETAVMRQRDAEAREAGRKPRRLRSWVPLSRVSRHLVHAVLSSEDQNFFGHEGVDWDAIEKSMDEDWKKRRFARGGSTITQQLAKNLFFTTHKSLVRKVRELIVARWLEADLGKRRILELYLNVIEWGDGVYGGQAAAQRYYGKSASALTAAEAAGLAAMIPSPRRINPRVDPRRHARAQRRVLWLMSHAGYLGKTGLGGEPPPPPEPEDDEEDAPPPLEAPATPVPEVPDPPAADPSPADPPQSLEPTPAPSEGPVPSPSPPSAAPAYPVPFQPR